jgi:hypothetical protein
MLNAVFLCRLEQVSKSFQYCAKKSWYNVYFASKKDVHNWLEDAKKCQIVSKELQIKAIEKRDASLKILNERSKFLACKHCNICDPRLFQDILDNQLTFILQEKYTTKMISDILDELQNSMIKCTTLCNRKIGFMHRGYTSIFTNKTDAITSWKFCPLVRAEANIDRTINNYRICDTELMEAIYAKNMIIHSFVEPKLRPNRAKNTKN